MNKPTLKNLIDIAQLSRETIVDILALSQELLDKVIKKNTCLNDLQGLIVANLFFEPSTRTCNSFKIAAQRLGALTISPDMQSSSLVKGESLLDTLHTFEAMGTQAFVIRHGENGITDWLQQQISTPIISAGEGSRHHPTQTLLDLLTIAQHKKNWAQLNIAIVGDLRHSRVTHSLVAGLSIMGVKQIRLIAPKALAPEKSLGDTVQVLNQLELGLDQADVIVTLRLQKERMLNKNLIDPTDYRKDFCLTKESLKQAKQDAIIMHPGPMNRDVEISGDVADGPHSVILSQVTNGVAVRMALLKLLLAPGKS